MGYSVMGKNEKPQHMKKLSIIGSFFMELFTTILGFFTGLKDVIVNLIMGVYNTIKHTVNSVAKKVHAISLRGPLTAAAIILVYLSMGHLFTIPLKAKTVLGAPQSFVGRAWVGTTLMTYTVNDGFIKTATSPLSSTVYVQIPLVGWLKV